jgi:asparagine synthase (glutamine-hydrolysing)
MCGIWAHIQCNASKNDASKNDASISKWFSDFYELKHRGPTNSYFETYENVCIGFHRLAIIDDTFQSNQPFILEDGERTIIFICNGEIYNFKELIHTYDLSDSIKNDCMVLPEIYMKLCSKREEHTFLNVVQKDVKGEFAFLLFEFSKDKRLQKLIVSRDEIGVRPLYYHPYNDDTSTSLFFTSELKGGIQYKDELIEFPPGNTVIYTFSENGKVVVDYNDYSSVYQVQPPPYIFDERLKTLQGLQGVYEPTEHIMLQEVRTSVTNSVQRRLVADKPMAFLLSGGVDSSLVAALSAKALGQPIRTFCCGMSEGTDLKFARKVAEHIGSIHTEVFFTPEEGLNAIPDVIRTIESWDTTTVRASVGQYLVSKYIGTQTDCKVVMVGEGPDEVCSSYLFNWYAPNGDALDKCAKDYVKKIHYYDVKRADRCIARWGLEGRVPLLDPEFIRSYWKIPAEERMPTYTGMEKWWLRKAFEVNKDLPQDNHVLPEEVLWRKKEAMSDGISSKEKSWFQIIQEYVEDKVTDAAMEYAPIMYPYCTPQTKEAYWYRKLFCEFFGEHRQKVIPGFWQPKWHKNGEEVREYVDPSARTLTIY